jgi:hypothetical protein
VDEASPPVPLTLLNYVLPRNLVWQNEPQFSVHTPCFKCNGTGSTTDTNRQFNTSLTLNEKRCADCEGRGHNQAYMTLDQLYQALAPAFYQHFLNQLPDIIEEAKMAVIESVMES